MTNPCNKLIECNSCHKEIGAMAPACPGCGSPNAWVHPAIQRLMDEAQNIPTTRRFMLHHDKTAAWGETDPLHTPASVIIMTLTILLCVLLSLFAFVAAVVIGFVGFIVAAKTKRKETFRADLCAGTWASSNDEFWLPVIDVLGIKP